MTDDAARDHAVQLGGIIKEARSGKHSLSQLSRIAGVSAGLISQIERGKANPSFMTLAKLAIALGIPLGSLFTGPSVNGRRVVRKNERKSLITAEALAYEVLTPDLQGSISMIRSVIPTGFDNHEAPFVHTGEECVHVLTGELEIGVGGQLYSLETGDSITYDASLPHYFRNRSGRVAEIIGAGTPPSF
jgi:transcriptional regulator with XRE-family HTH domain